MICYLNTIKITNYFRIKERNIANYRKYSVIEFILQSANTYFISFNLPKRLKYSTVKTHGLFCSAILYKCVNG